MQSGAHYTATEAQQVLGLASSSWLHRLRREGIIPFEERDANYYYDKDYVDGLAAKLKQAESQSSQPRDIDLVTLWYLRYLYVNRPPGMSRSEHDKYVGVIKRQRLAMVADGRAWTPQQLRHALRNVRVSETITDWVTDGKVVSVQIANRHYMSGRYARHIVWLLTRCERLMMVAASLGVNEEALLRRVRLHGFKTLHGPDNFMRLSPQVVARMRQEFKPPGVPTTYSVSETAERLGVDIEALNRQIRRGTIASTGPVNNKRLLVSEVEQWRTKFRTLNPGFEWLQRHIDFAGRKPRLIEPAPLRRQLGISEDVLSEWAQANLLPFYVRSFDMSFRVYVALYVYGLRRFAAGQAITKRLLKKYLALCAKDQRIV